MIAIPAASDPSLTSAQVAVQAFPNVSISTSQGIYSLPVVMVAVAGAESSWIASNRGDYGLGSPSCGGYTSFGLWQIHLPAWASVIARISGVPSSNPCGQAKWLYIPANNARMAALILGQNPQAGLRNWTTWTNGAYAHHLATAQAAVSTITQMAQASAPTSRFLIGIGTVPAWKWLVGGGIALGVVALAGAQGWIRLGGGG